jgi:integrase
MARAKGTGSIFKPKGSSFYWIAYISGGKRRYETTKSDVKQVAKDLLLERLGAIQHGVVVTPKLGKITLATGLKAVTSNLTMNGRQSADETQRRIDRHILWHAETDDEPAGGYFQPDRRMSTITTADIEAYKAHRIEQKAEPATLNRELAIVRRAFRLAVRGGELVAMPYVGLLRENNVRTGFFERVELHAVLTHLPEELHPPLKFAYGTGWRFKSEVLNLTVAQVDLDAGIVRLEPGTTKSGQGRTFYVTAELREILEGQLASINALKERGVICPYVFHRADGASIKDFKKTWRNACVAAGYPDKLFHDFRRTAVRNLERAGVPRSTAMAMVGHQTESIYRRYAIVDEAMHREAAALLDVWAGEQKAKAASKAKGKVTRFTRRKAG